MSSASQFTGSIPELYDRQLGPVLFEPYAADLASRLPLRDGLRVLELACGSGIVTRRLRETLPGSATLVATDLNEAMVSYARAAVAAPGIEWSQADIQELPFEDASFDVVVCQFGFMFMPDKVRGFSESRRVLAEDGMLLGNVWKSLDENTQARVVNETLADLFPDDPPPFFDTPYGYAPDRVRADLEQAGWGDVRLEDVRLDGESPSADDYALGFSRGSPLSHELLERGADLDAVRERLAEALGDDRPLSVEQTALVITATR